MSNIPKARNLLRVILPELSDSHRRVVRNAINLMTRRPATRRAPRRHKPLTKQQVRDIRRYTLDHPAVHLQDIAMVFKTNSGRVSEAINWLRKGI